MESATLISNETPVLAMEKVHVPNTRDFDHTMIEDLSWNICAGDYWIIAGRLGSGKSDLLNVAAGLVRPLHGVVKLFGRDVTAIEGDQWLSERVRVGVVFEEGGRLFGGLTVEENIALPLCYHRNCVLRDVREEVDRLIELFELKDIVHSRPSRVNRAIRQRVALARALALKPDILLLDNPLGILEARHVPWWIDFLRSLAKGHPFLDSRKVTLVVTADTLRPWLSEGTHFACIQKKRWHPFRARAEIEQSDDPAIRELLN